MTTTHDCTLALRALASGDYAPWHGLGDACTTTQALAALGQPQSGDLTGDVGGSPTRYRIYPGTAVVPDGIYVWDVDDRIMLIRLHAVAATRPISDQLGEPDARQPSNMPGFKTQWVYASRGLTFHVDDGTGDIAFVYAYRPMTTDEFRASWLSRVEIRRTPVR